MTALKPPASRSTSLPTASPPTASSAAATPSAAAKAPVTDTASGKPRRVPRAERELQMLEAAARLFGEKGFEATSMDDVAHACGVTKPMVYSYFESKEGLYSAMIHRAGTHLVSAFLDIGQEPDPARRLKMSLQVFLEFVERYGPSWRMVFSQPPSGVKALDAIAGYRQQIMQAAIYTLARFRPPGTDGATARALVEPYAHALLGAGEAVAQWWLHHPEKTRDEAARAINDMIDATLHLLTIKLSTLPATSGASGTLTGKRGHPARSNDRSAPPLKPATGKGRNKRV